MQISQVVRETKAVVGNVIDDADATLEGWANEAIRDLVTLAGWNRSTVNIGPIVAGQSVYALPAEVYEVLDLLVGPDPLLRVGEPEMEDLKAGRTRQASPVGFYSPSFDSSAGRKVEIYPPPDTNDDGAALTAKVVKYPGTFTGDDEITAAPAEYHRAIVHRAIAIGLDLGDEDTAGADRHNTIFANYVERLRRHHNRQVSGTVERALIAGMDF